MNREPYISGRWGGKVHPILKSVAAVVAVMKLEDHAVS